ncbi:MAG TPA: RidA family protein [Candidatus Avimonoglobus intestinipullorum]|uniref:RidA family protein n=1 Tax=Candidatus Avimonoglobus intestinipullorum TaxID=2840699 RepID=A0A9D1S6C3_9FIRM|nr:RidA family protein [Candidatus Avimonoglobus intestinipullorum]
MNTIHTTNAPEAIGPYSQAVVHNGILYTSGQIALNPASGMVEAQTIEAQTEQVMKNLEAVLKAAGTDFTTVLKTTCFLKNMSDFSIFNEIYAKYFTGKPARSCVAAKELPKDVLVEVELIAAVE